MNVRFSSMEYREKVRVISRIRIFEVKSNLSLKIDDISNVIVSIPDNHFDEFRSWLLENEIENFEA